MMVSKAGKYLLKKGCDDMERTIKVTGRGKLSLKNDGSIMISDSLSEIDRVFTNVRSDMSIELTEGNKGYLQYHRENVYKGNKQ